ncbi:phage/plasmid primase, P4 family [Chloroflexota bacterium]
MSNAKDYTRTPDRRWILKNKAPIDVKELEMLNLTDMGNAERLIRGYGDYLRYCYETGYWLVWNGKVWGKDTGAQIMALAKETVRNIYVEAANTTNDHQRKELADHAKKSESESKLHAMIALARDIAPIKVQDLDVNNMLFNCQNGTIDLRTGVLSPHKRDDLITLISPVEYDPNAHSDLWEQHLLRVTGNNRELIVYLQRLFGYCLTGETKEQVMFFVFGPTKTGKSKTLGAVVWVLGDYAKQTPSETLLVKRYSGHSDKARLVGSRMVVAIEAEKGERLASASIKNMTGEDRMTARFLYKENFEFYPTFKIFLVANDKPLIRGEDSAMWERVKLIPFKQFIPMGERDKDLAEKLKEEGKGILAWMMKGCLDWQKYKDLLEPGEVTTETAIYRSEMDILGDFLDDCCAIEKTARVAHSDLYQAYEEWCHQNDEEPITKKMLTIELQGRNFVSKRGHAGKKIWHGLALKGYQEGDSGDTYNPVSIKSPLEEKQKKVIQTSENESPKSPLEFENGARPSCSVCGGTTFWARTDGERICSRCHPKPS